LVKQYFLSTITLALIVSIASPALALEEQNVLVLYNAASTDSLQVAQHYAQVHPNVSLLGLEGVAVSETITAENYLSVIRPQVMAYLDSPAGSNVECFVTTTDMPLRIVNTHANPGTYDGWRGDDGFFPRPINDTEWKPYSSLESELTRIATIDSWEAMGDQAYTLGPPFYGTTPHHATNPYYNATGEFDSASYDDIYLASRIDGYTVADAIAAVDRAQQAVFNPAGEDAFVIVDDAPNTTYDRMGLLANELASAGQPAVVDSTSQAVLTAPGEVIGYVSHGTNDGAGGLESGYIANQLDIDIAAGAVFASYESYNACSFTEAGRRVGQALLADWIAAGGSAAVGYVEEPMTGSTQNANEDIMWRMLLEGYTWGEAAWASLYQLSYVSTVVGDPLMVFGEYAAVLGDFDGDGVADDADIDLLTAEIVAQGGDLRFDLDGDGDVDAADRAILIYEVIGTVDGDVTLDFMVDVADLVTICNAYGQPGQWGWSDGDVTGDGLVDLSDLVMVANNFGQVANPVPEPLSLSLLLAGGVALLRKRR
jgi:uncharacterized protein (TIGR03790 family)